MNALFVHRMGRSSLSWLPFDARQSAGGTGPVRQDTLALYIRVTKRVIQMTTEYVKCSCCGKMVPASDIELAFIRPGVIARLSEEE